MDQEITIHSLLSPANVRVTDRGCVLWLHAKASTGYGLISVPYTKPDGTPARHMIGVHRLMWNLTHPHDPIKPGEDIRRNEKCSGNKLCINPEHLFKATRAMYLPKGAQMGAAHHDPEQIAIIKRMMLDGMGPSESARWIEEQTGIPMSRANASLIKSGKIWGNIPPAAALAATRSQPRTGTMGLSTGIGV